MLVLSQNPFFGLYSFQESQFNWGFYSWQILLLIYSKTKLQQYSDW